MQRRGSSVSVVTSPGQNEDDPVRVLMVNDHLGYDGGAVHGGTTLFYAVLSRLNPKRVRGQLCILKQRHPAADRFEAIGLVPIFLGRSKWDVRALPDLIRLVREQEVDILHVHTMKAFLLGRLAAAVTGCRVIVHFHDANRPGYLLGMIQRLLAPWTDLALVVSTHVKEMAMKAYAIPGHRIRVFPNGVEVKRLRTPRPDARHRLREAWGVADTTPLIGVIGRMAEGKGQALFLEKLTAVIDDVPDVRVVFVGDGPTRSTCEALAADLGLEANVHFDGHRDDIPDVLATVDVVALPSVLQEGHPLTVLEAMAAGKPVVAFDVGGTVEIIDHGQNGLLVPRGDFSAFAAAVTRLLSSEDLRARLGRNGQQRARDFSISAYVARLEETYLRVANGSRGR